MDKYVVLIPARGGSKSIPLKNIRPIAGKPLIHWVIEAALACQRVEKVYLSTDSQEIGDVALQIRNDKLEVIARAPETATDTASTESVMIELMGKWQFENLILVQATSPLLTTQDIDGAIDEYEAQDADSLLTMVEQKRFLWRTEDGIAVPVNYDPRKRPRRQDFQGHMVENGALYITSRKALEGSGCRLSGRIAFYVMPEESYYELDEPHDWKVIEALLEARSKDDKELARRLQGIKLFVTDVDGVLTDGGMYYTENGDELKKFNTRDGMAIQLMREMGIRTAIITKEDTKIVHRRSKKLKVDDIFQGIDDKLKALGTLLERYDVDPSETVFIGDDINDIQVLKKVGVSVCPSDAIAEVKEVCDIMTRARGGQGVVREFVELLRSHRK